MKGNNSSTPETECLGRTNNTPSDFQTSQNPYCTSSWDGRFCWPQTLAGRNITLLCSQTLANESSPRSLKGEVSRFCTSEAQWEESSWGNYTSCDQTLFQSTARTIPPNFRNAVANILFFGSLLSLLCLAMALFIFYYFKRIRCDRVTIHIHFMWALALKCLFFIIITQPVIIKSFYSFRKIEWICKLVLSSQLYTYEASINWMLVEGHYLNSKLSTHIFAKKPPMKIYYFFGWGISFLTIIIWYIVMEQFHDPTRCWRGYGKSKILWIIIAPLLTVLLANIVFLGNILRVLMTKLQLTSQESEGQQVRRGIKTTLFLFPLLGLNILLFFVNPGGIYQPYYMLGNSILHSSQGMLVAVLYCFISPDVREAVRREWNRIKSVREFQFDRSQVTGSAYFAASTRVRRNSSNTTTREPKDAIQLDDKMRSGETEIIIDQHDT